MRDRAVARDMAANSLAAVAELDLAIPSAANSAYESCTHAYAAARSDGWDASNDAWLFGGRGQDGGAYFPPIDADAATDRAQMAESRLEFRAHILRSRV